MELGDEMAGSKRPAEEPELEGAPDLKRLASDDTAAWGSVQEFVHAKQAPHTKTAEPGAEVGSGANDSEEGQLDDPVVDDNAPPPAPGVEGSIEAVAADDASEAQPQVAAAAGEEEATAEQAACSGDQVGADDEADDREEEEQGQTQDEVEGGGEAAENVETGGALPPSDFAIVLHTDETMEGEDEGEPRLEDGARNPSDDAGAAAATMAEESMATEAPETAVHQRAGEEQDVAEVEAVVEGAGDQMKVEDDEDANGAADGVHGAVVVGEENSAAEGGKGVEADKVPAEDGLAVGRTETGGDVEMGEAGGERVPAEAEVKREDQGETQGGADVVAGSAGEGGKGGEGGEASDSVKQGVTSSVPAEAAGDSGAMANAAGEGYVVRAPVAGSRGSTEKKQLKETDALEYLNLVKQQFGNSPEIYNKFLDIMKDFKSHAIDTQKVIERVSRLFVGHQRLILGFNTFLPAGYKIEVRNPAGQQVKKSSAGGSRKQQDHAAKKAPAPEFDHAYSYVSKIKQRFAGNQEVYQKFLQILQRYKEEGFAIGQVKAQVAQLFAGHEDLLGEFSNFLPEPGSAAKLALQKGSKKKSAGAKGAAGDLAGLLGGAGVSRHVAELIKSVENMQTTGQVAGQGGASQPGQLSEMLKTLLAAPRGDGQGPSEAQMAILKSNPALIQLLKQQVESNRSGGAEAKEGKKKEKDKKSGADLAAQSLRKEAILLEKVKKKLVVMGDNCYTDFLKCLGLYVQDVLTATELVTVLEDMMGSSDVRDVFDELKVFLGIRDGPASKYRFNVPMSEIDFTGCPASGVSYRSVPRDYPLPSCTGRTDLCDRTLNDEWVSVPSGSEDFSYAHYRKNQYEESLFKCEDDRFELDMLIETNASTMRVLEQMLEEADKARGGSATHKLNLSLLRAVHLKAIQRVYGDHGAEMVDHLKRAPRIALQVVLPRLKAKDDEWRKARRDMNKIWRDVYKDNYYKSLDHRSFYFKQVDKKSLHPKHFLWEMRTQTVLADAKDLRPAAAAGGDAASAAAPPGAGAAAAQAGTGAGAALRQPLALPCLSFAMGRGDIHKQILEVMLRSSAAELHEGAEARVRKFFSTFLHVLLGLKDRSLEEIKTSSKEWSKRLEALKEAGEDGAESGAGADKRGKKGKGKRDGEEGEEGGEGEGGDADKDKDDKVEEEEEERDSEEDAEEEEEEEGEDLWQSVHSLSPCWLPLTPLADGQGGEGDEADGGIWGLRVEKGVKVFYGNLSCYVFFRLYQKLYQRLVNAHFLAQVVQQDKEEAGEGGGDTEMGEGEEDGAGPADDEDDDGQASGDKDKKKKPVYDQFLAMLFDLVEGHTDTSKFEDDCRVLLGTNSYELYTLEKLVEKLLAQVLRLAPQTPQQTVLVYRRVHEEENVHIYDIYMYVCVCACVCRHVCMNVFTLQMYISAGAAANMH